MAYTERTAGETTIGSSRTQSTLGINTLAGTASGVVFVSADGTETCLWARNNGKLYRGTRADFATPEAAGTALD